MYEKDQYTEFKVQDMQGIQSEAEQTFWTSILIMHYRKKIPKNFNTHVLMTG